MLTLFRKEILSFLNSLIGYVAIIVFLAINGLYLWVFPGAFNLVDYGYASLDNFFVIAPFVFLFLIPAITMRSFAEEKRAGTIEILITKPITDFSILMAKYLAGLTLVVVSLLPTLIYVFSVYQLGLPKGNLDFGGLWGSYIGLLFLATAFTAIGLFVSSVTDNQIVAFIAGLVISGFAYIGFELIADMALFGKASLFIKSLGIQEHYASMSRGVIDTRDVLYFLSVNTVFLLLSKISLESRKWDRYAKRNNRLDNTVQLAAGLIIIVLINIIGSYLFTRFDLTSEKRYTLSKSTRKLIRETDDIIYFKVYLEGEFPSGFKRLSQSTREMLDEFRAYSDNIQYEFIDPTASEDPKTRKDIYDRLIEQGLVPTDLAVRTKEGQKQQSVFPGALVTYKGRTIPISLLANQLGAPPEAIINNSIQALEYNIVSAIRKLSSVLKPKIAFTQGHGELIKLETADIAVALSDYYTVEYADLKGNINAFTERAETEPGKFNIVNKYEALIIAKPDSLFNEKDKFLIDQFVMRGGKILWLIDPVFATMDSLQTVNRTIGITQDINLNDLLFKYGVRLNSNLIMDLAALPIPMVTGYMGNQPQFGFFPWPYFPVLTSTSSHPVVKNINAVRTEFISSIDTVGDPSIKKTILLRSSQYTRIAQTPVMITLEILGRDPNTRDYSDQPQAVAVLLEGEFESVFNNRIPKEISQAPEIGFTKKSDKNRMVVISDGDVIKNQVQFSNGNYIPLPLGYDRHTGQTFGNKELIMNAVNFLCDDEGLMAVRSRELRLRALDVTKARENLLMWQLTNIAVPVLLIIIFGIIQFAFRKRRFSK